MTTYRAEENAIVDQDGKQAAVILASNCTKKFAALLAQAAAKEANHIATEQARLNRGETAAGAAPVEAQSKRWSVAPGDPRWVIVPGVVKPINAGSAERARLIVDAVNASGASG